MTYAGLGAIYPDPVIKTKQIHSYLICFTSYKVCVFFENALRLDLGFPLLYYIVGSLGQMYRNYLEAVMYFIEVLTTMSPRMASFDRSAFILKTRSRHTQSNIDYNLLFSIYYMITIHDQLKI